MFSDGPWNRDPASSPKLIWPRDSEDDPLRVQTTKIVEPGRYSHRSTALPRSERNVKLGSPNVNVGAGPPPSASTAIVEGPPAVSGVTTTVPMSSDRKSTRLNSSHSQISYAV